MTREEEIKARLENDDYMDPGKFLDQAPDDLRYILARNEELQREKEKMAKALQFYARLDDDMSYDEIEEDHGRRAVEALAANERPDA